MTNETAAHAIYAPSSAHRWSICTASAPALAALPEQEEGEEAAEGTEAHEEIERILGPWASSNYTVPPGALDPDHPAAYGIALLIDYVRKLPGGRLWVEQRVRLTDDIWGRCDVAHWHEESATLTIVDYKNGYVDVDAVKNEQLRIYGASSIYTHKLPAKWVRYVVVQPNSFMPVPRVKQWIESSDALFAFANEVAKVPALPLDQRKFVFGSAQCRDCRMFGLCPPTKDLLLHLSTALNKPAEEVTPEKAGLFLAAEKPIEHWFKALYKSTTKAALGGASVPGMKVVTSTKHREWKDTAAARDAVVAAYGVVALSPPTPAQAEKLGMPEADVTKLSHKPDGGPALAFESDKRPAFVRKTGAEMFAGVGGAK
jgi:hypothetical protein